jgi:Uncharacterised nucleotidyltransferase
MVMPKSVKKSLGRLVAEALTGAWREMPPPFELSASEFDEVTPLLLRSGSAALGWWRVRHSSLSETQAADDLHQAYRLLELRAAIHVENLKALFKHLRAAGVEPLLVKGWAIARLYPSQALRPYGDMDIAVRPADYEVAGQVLQSAECARLWVDLHHHFEELEERTLEELYARSRLLKLDEMEVRVLGPEDHFALLCIHWLKHGAWRPPALCDIGVALETLPADFDWDLCLGRSRTKAGWITCTIGLARLLLGARVPDEEIARRASRLPSWLLPNVLKQWETPFNFQQAPFKHQAPMEKYLHNPRGLLDDMRARWPNPIVATISLNGPFNEIPRFPFQLGNCLSRTAKFLAHLPGLLGEQQ